ncbi:MAG TPA: MBL fold metallo-hydrolase [Candidatus Acidoferrum sp.]|nr:MBL fold metallo-hydrolase [Candidatus Acidoferrum sp.]
MFFSRRQFLSSASAAGAWLALGARSSFAAPTPAALQWQDLGDGLALIQGAGGNVLAISGKDGIALVDGGNEAAAGKLLELVKTKTGSVPSLLFNSHCHRDQVGCNQLLGKQKATIVAHENTKLWLGTEIISKWERQTYPPLPKAALPNKTFYYDTETLQFNHRLVYGWMQQSHTDGDIYVHLPERNVLFVGDVVSANAYPVLDYCTNGWIGGMITGLTQLLALCDNNTKVIASSGVVDKAHVQQQLDMCSALADRVGTAYYKGASLPEFLAGKPTAEFDAAWGKPELFIAQAWEGTLPHVTEIRRYGKRA